MPHLLLLRFLPLLYLLLSCNKPDKPPKTGDCPPDLACTMEFRTITITVKDSSNNPVSLDQYRTIRLSDNHIFDLRSAAGTWEDSTWRATGTYPVITDGQQKELSTSGELLEFQGDRNGIPVVRERYQIKDNCCHVELISGNTGVQVN